MADATKFCVVLRWHWGGSRQQWLFSLPLVMLDHYGGVWGSRERKVLPGIYNTQKCVLCHVTCVPATMSNVLRPFSLLFLWKTQLHCTKKASASLTMRHGASNQVQSLSFGPLNTTLFSELCSPLVSEWEYATMWFVKSLYHIAAFKWKAPHSIMQDISPTARGTNHIHFNFCQYLVFSVCFQKMFDVLHSKTSLRPPFEHMPTQNQSNACV